MDYITFYDTKNIYYKEMGMPHKSGFEILAVWTMTGIGNLVAYMTGWVEYLPVIQNIIAIISILLAIGYTLYKWRKDWGGVDPRKKK